MGGSTAIPPTASLFRERFIYDEQPFLCGYERATGRFWRIVLPKSFGKGERKFLDPLMRFACGEVRDMAASGTPNSSCAFDNSMPRTHLSLRQARQPQTVCETGAMLRQPDRDPSVKRGDTKRGIKLAQMVGRLSSLIYSSGKRMTCGDDKQYER